MPDYIEAVTQTRQTASTIFAHALEDLNGKSEIEIRDEALKGTAQHQELFPMGWYDPPHGGLAVLFGDGSYDRLKFQSLRNPKSFPNQTNFSEESVGIFYMSPVDRATGMFGDTGFTVYRGKDAAIKEHLKTTLAMVLDVAEQAEVGMRFCDLYESAMEHFRTKGQKMIGWMTTTHDPMNINLGHTTPGSYGDGEVLGATFEETREAIRIRRLYINAVEQFEIPATCAFTVEARLTDLEAKLPNAFFHAMVTFSNGKKNILIGFDDIFRTVGMDYIL